MATEDDGRQGSPGSVASTAASPSLAEVEARLRFVISGAPVVLFATDRQGVFVLSEGKALRAIGLSPGEVVGRSVFELYADTPWAVDSIRRALDGESLVAVGEANGRWWETTFTPARDEAGQLSGLIGVAVDVTERRQSELDKAQLLEAERRARDEAQAAERRVAFLYRVTHTMAGADLDQGARMALLAELAVPEFADYCILELLDEHDPQGDRIYTRAVPDKVAILEQVRSYLPNSRRATHPAGVAFRTGVGQRFTRIEDSALQAGAADENHLALLRQLAPRSTLFLPLEAHGSIVGTLCFSVIDRVYDEADFALGEELARRAAMTLEKAHLYEESRRAVREREDLLAIVSHDLKNPLLAIQMNVGLLLRELPPDLPGQRFRRAIESMNRSAERMSRLIGYLTELDRIEGGRLVLERRRHEAAILMTDAVDSMASIFDEKQLFLEQWAGSVGAYVSCDRERIHQVLSNLLGNAAKFTPARGRVRIALEVSAHEVEFSVADTGPGLSQEQLRSVFERFWQARETARLGSGLGLFIARAIVEAHGGRIWAESTADKGSTFRFTLPLVP